MYEAGIVQPRHQQHPRTYARASEEIFESAAGQSYDKSECQDARFRQKGFFHEFRSVQAWFCAPRALENCGEKRFAPETLRALSDAVGVVPRWAGVISEIEIPLTVSQTSAGSSAFAGPNAPKENARPMSLASGAGDAKVQNRPGCHCVVVSPRCCRPSDIYIYICMLPPPSDLPFVAFIAWKPPELLKEQAE